jgi:O-acetyl-ADP-ribose deacetylase (regulator of RNase III)
MITYIKGDLFAEKHPMIAHGCNARRVMGSGVAKIIRNKYPKAFVDYIKAFEDQDKANIYGDTPQLMMGRVIASHQSDTIILNWITQKSFGKDTIKYVSYDAVDKCCIYTTEYVDMYKPSYLVMPKIGAGLGNGHWPVIEAITLM